ncbi:Actin-related protein 7 [Asimina triloba]
MEAVVVDAGSKLLKAGFAVPDQDPAMVTPAFSLSFFMKIPLNTLMPSKDLELSKTYALVLQKPRLKGILFASVAKMVIPTKMKRMPEEGQMTDSAFEEITVDPVVRGFIKDWDAMEDLLHHVLYTGLGWEIGNEGQILFTDPLSTPKAVRERLVQLMFETFNVTGFYASEQAVLSLYAVGRISGCTVDIGHGKIDIAPVYEGAVQHIASKRFEIGGIDLTNLLANDLRKSNPLVKIDISDVEKLKEQYACCVEDQFAYEDKLKSCPVEKHVLPDGQVITIERERFIVGEALFQPSILGLEEHGIVEQLVRCISTVSTENQRQLIENTVLCGGTASMTGFEERFQREANLCSSSIRPALIKPPEYMPENLPKNSAWMGGAILAKVVFPQNQHVTKGDYDESGPAVVHKKCF